MIRWVIRPCATTEKRSQSTKFSRAFTRMPTPIEAKNRTPNRSMMSEGGSLARTSAIAVRSGGAGKIDFAADCEHRDPVVIRDGGTDQIIVHIGPPPAPADHRYPV